MLDQTIFIFTDGACSGNPGPGGWGVLIKTNQDEKTLNGGAEYTTNNQMELQAAIEGLRSLQKPSQVVLTTDSNYLRQGITQWIDTWQKNNWLTASKNPVKNKTLWLELLQEKIKHDITWRWVKGHSGHPENDRADALARQAILQLMK
ncbi:MAG: ribonuclease HI [Endozoicomonadaceae bacterium]|nr:ribonuclease HI [Endozoicomonadaceae bacterium]